MSQGFLSAIGRSVVKSYCPKWVYFWGDFLGGGVNDPIFVKTLDLAPKMTSTIWCCDVMIIWYVRRVIRVITLITLLRNKSANMLTAKVWLAC